MTMAQISKFLLLPIWNFITLRTSPFEAILIKFLAVPKSGVNRSLCYRGGLSFRCHKNQQLRRQNLKVVNGQRIKHYISGHPINVETNVIETVTPEEYIRDTLHNVSDSEKK